ncbi:MAG: hypothetical protein RLY20_1615 [Verrucomicrobiota bacterium]|jgi:LysM repeat protein
MAALQSGCMPSSQGPADEQKESFFLKGKALEGTLDFKGAIEAYEKAIEVNPQNGSAHFELGLLYEKDNDNAAAIYHFERYLKLRPDSERMQIVKDRIMQNKMELAKTTTYAPLTQNTQKQFDALNDEIRQLRADNEKLKADLVAAQNRPVTSNPGGGQIPQRLIRTSDTAQSGQSTQSSGSGATRSAADADSRSAARTYSVKQGDTPSSIARKFNVKLDSLLTLNPGLDPKKMKVGQVVKIPSSS